MPAQVIDGEAVAAQVKEQLKTDVAALSAAGKSVKLVAVIATENKGAKMYASFQQKACDEVGIAYELAELPADSDEAAIIARISNSARSSLISSAACLWAGSGVSEEARASPPSASEIWSKMPPRPLLDLVDEAACAVEPLARWRDWWSR